MAQAASMIQAGITVDVGMTVDVAMTMPCFAGSSLVAGKAGRHNHITGVAVVEDGHSWLQVLPGELLVTTATSFRNDPGALATTVRQVAERQPAAVCIQVGDHLEFIPSPVHAAANDCGMPLIKITPTTRLNDIVTEMLGWLLNERAQGQEQARRTVRELSAASTDGGTRQLLTTLARILDAPIALRDRHGKPLVSIGDAPRSLVDTDGSVTPPYRQEIEGPGGGDIAVWAITDRLEPHQLAALEQAATIIAVVTAHEREFMHRDEQQRHLVLTELMSGLPFDRAEMIRHGYALGHDLSVSRAAVVVEHGDLGADTATRARIVRHIEQRLAQLDPMSWAVPYGVALLIRPSDTPAALARDLRHSIEQRWPGTRIAIGVGRTYRDVMDFYRSYRDAVETLRLGRTLFGRGFALAHDDLGLHRLLAQIPPDSLRELVSDQLGPLLDHDSRRSSALLPTLTQYFRANGNRVATADALTVHYNTLRYRLDQIEQLVGPIDRQRSKRLQLELAIYAHEILEAGAGE